MARRPWSSVIDWRPGGAFEAHVSTCRLGCSLSYGPVSACSGGLGELAKDHARRPAPSWRPSKPEPVKR